MFWLSIVSADRPRGLPDFPRHDAQLGEKTDEEEKVRFRVARLGRARLILAATVTLSLAALACTAGVLTARASAASRDAEASRQAESAAEAIGRRMDQYVEVLRGLSGWIGQTGWPSHGDFHDYLRRADVIRRYRGVQVVGAAQLIDRGQRLAHQRTVTDQIAAEGLGYPEYVVHPDRGNAQALPVDYIEPLAGNEPAFGFDFFSEERRRSAAERARDLGTPFATTPVELVQDPGGGQISILVMAPVYQPEVGISTIAQRRTAFVGVVYAAFRMTDLLDAIMPDNAERVRIYDTGSTYAAPLSLTPSHLLFGRPGETAGAITRSVDTTVAGRRWTLVYRPLIVSPPADRYAPWVLGMVGILLALLAGAFFWATATGQSRAEAHALATSAELVRTRAAATRRLELLLDCSGEGIYGIDPDGVIIFVNRKAAELLGRDVDDLLGRNAHEVMHDRRPDGSPYPVQDCPIYHSLHTGEPCRVDDEVLWRADGTALPVEYSAAPMEDEGVVITFSDSTVRRRTEQALRELDQTRTDFVSTVSHELRTPLTSIGGYLEIILDGDTGPVPDRQREMIAIAQRNCQRLLLLVEDLLTLSRVEAATFAMVERPVDVTALLDGVARTVAPLAAAKTHRLTVDVSGDCGTVLGDAAQLERVVLNLLSNAVKFTPAYGAITLRAARAEDCVIIAVTDNGIGIPEAEQTRLFERFFRSSTARDQAIQGTGLGLSIVKNIVEQHGGAISAESAEGTGTTMTITLPLMRVHVLD
jgi:PAS domain S-box-containing protein